MSSSIDASELVALSRDLGKIGAKSTRVMFGVYKQAGDILRDQWRANAAATSGTHGKHYPNSITADMRVSTNIEVEVGPDPRLPQGGMSFEYGSSKQPAHLDGQKAADHLGPVLGTMVDQALKGLGL